MAEVSFLPSTNTRKRASASREETCTLVEINLSGKEGKKIEVK